MRPKKKATHIFNKMEVDTNSYDSKYPNYSERQAKECALVCVDEIIKELHKVDKGYNLIDRIEYWGLVKDELNRF